MPKKSTPVKQRAKADLVIRDASELVTVKGEAPLLKEDTSDLHVISGGWIASHRGKITFVGDEIDFTEQVQRLRNCKEIDAKGRTVLPGFVDCHTHPIYAGDRGEEFARRLRGVDYERITAEGGGILTSVEATRGASEEELFERASRRLDRMLLHGTTSVEVKSGYGLSTEDELKQLRVARQLAAEHPLTVVPTFMGAHSVPPEYQERREEYVALIRDEMLPAVAGDGLAEYCDVFCDEGVFSVEESRSVLEKAAELGMGLRVHAEELTPSGGATLAAELKAVSAEHLVHITGEQGEALAEAGTTAVLLPGTIFFLLKQKYAPALRLIDQGVPVAIATDCNPGSCNTESIPMAIVLACLKMGLSVEQAIAASTLNAAYAIRRHDTVGSLEVGKAMDVIILDAPSRIHLAYHFGVNIVDTVVKKGQVVVREGCRV